MAATTTTGPKAGGAGGADRELPRVRDLALAPKSGRGRMPEVAVALVLVLGFGLAGVLWHLRSVDRAAAVAVSEPITRGEPISAGDLRVVYVADGEALAYVDPSDSRRLVGASALVDLPAGALITPGMVARPSPVGPGDGIVGLSLEPGQYPEFDLAPGDLVDVVVIGGGSGESGEGPSSAVVAEGAEVHAIRDLAGGEQKLISLKASTDAADAIAAVDQASVRLVRVSS
jgi:hypothetical protein